MLQYTLWTIAMRQSKLLQRNLACLKSGYTWLTGESCLAGSIISASVAICYNSVMQPQLLSLCCLLPAPGSCLHGIIASLMATFHVQADSSILKDVKSKGCCLLCRGYSTQAEKDAAKDTKGVRLINLTEFQELLQWGILMGVSPEMWVICFRPVCLLMATPQPCEKGTLLMHRLGSCLRGKVCLSFDG